MILVALETLMGYCEIFLVRNHLYKCETSLILYELKILNFLKHL
jgi:hypothetical protein